MKKIIVILPILLILIFGGCFFMFPERPSVPETEYELPYATNINGEFVPKHENVDESPLDPTLFSLDENGRMTYADASRTLIHGIDVSVFQGDIDWSAVKNDGIDFVILRVGYRGYGAKGIMEIDENFYKNYDGASKAGLDVGVYFYSQAVNAEEAREEARYVLDAVKDCTLTYPIVYDWEYVGNDASRTKDMTSEQITVCAEAFCSEIELAGFDTVIYFNCELGYFEYDLSRLNTYDFWLAEYNSYPTFLYDYKMWQYSEKGAVAGIDGPCDLNISLVDYSQPPVVG